MRFLKILFFIGIYSSLSTLLFSQRYRNGINEFGIQLGGSNYFGDLAPEIVLKETHFAAGVFYKYHHSKYFTSRYQFTYASISGNDNNFNSNLYRNLSFQSQIFELGYFTEFNFKPFGINVREEHKTVYVFSGINLFHFDPKVRLAKGDLVSLRDLATEGQVVDKKKKYSLIQPAITLGIGYKFNIGRKYVIGTEIGFRKTFTDYLDDTKNNYPSYAAILAAQGLTAAEISHAQTLNNQPPIHPNTMRGDKHLKDWYFIFGITISKRSVNLQPCPSSM
ncbi:MAG: DUF6089 family protein [Bacteroidota bacterium]|nr:DUF6089 family protein [Bacteroidota bacterium]